LPSGKGEFLAGVVADATGLGLKAHGKYRFESQPWLYAFGEAQGRRAWGGGFTGYGIAGIGGNF
jgi:hypothetical protein